MLEAFRLLAQGLSIRKAAQRVLRHPNTVWKWVKQVRGGKIKFDDIRSAMAEEGLTVNEVELLRQKLSKRRN